MEHYCHKHKRVYTCWNYCSECQYENLAIGPFPKQETCGSPSHGYNYAEDDEAEPYGYGK